MYQWSSKDDKSKVVKDSIEAIEKNKSHMTSEQVHKAYSQMMRGLGTDGVSQLRDRKSSNNFQ